MSFLTSKVERFEWIQRFKDNKKFRGLCMDFADMWDKGEHRTGRNILSFVDPDYGENCFMLAIRYNRSVAEYLLNDSMWITSKLAASKDHYYNSIVHYLCVYQPDLAIKFFDSDLCTKRLFKSQTYTGVNILHWSARENPKLMKIIMDHDLCDRDMI